eukprot:1190614-Prorocentrum_minimum.AAC.2
MECAAKTFGLSCNTLVRVLFICLFGKAGMVYTREGSGRTHLLGWGPRSVARHFEVGVTRQDLNGQRSTRVHHDHRVVLPPEPPKAQAQGDVVSLVDGHQVLLVVHAHFPVGKCHQQSLHHALPLDGQQLHRYDGGWEVDGVSLLPCKARLQKCQLVGTYTFSTWNARSSSFKHYYHMNADHIFELQGLDIVV